MCLMTTRNRAGRMLCRPLARDAGANSLCKPLHQRLYVNEWVHRAAESAESASSDGRNSHRRLIVCMLPRLRPLPAAMATLAGSNVEFSGLQSSPSLIGRWYEQRLC